MTDDFAEDFELDGDDDLGNVPVSPDPIAGTYLCTIAKMEKKARRDGKGNYINIQFKIDDVKAETHDAYVGRSVFDILNLGSEALWKIKQLIVAVRGEDGAQGNRIPNMTDEQVVLDAFVDTYNGQENLRTRKYRSAEGWVGLNLDLTQPDDDSDDSDDAAEEKAPPPKSSSKAKKPSKSGSSNEVEI